MIHYKRSPFLFTYWNEDNKLILYNYNRHTKAAVSTDVIKLLEILKDWKSDKEIFDLVNTDILRLRRSLKQLVKLKFIHEKPLADEDHSAGTTRWEPTDLAVQRQRSYGGAYPLSERIGKSPSSIKHVKGLSSHILRKINNSNDPGKEHSFLSTLDKRKSIRWYGSNHISLDELSGFLYSSARIKKIFKTEQGVLTQRPYPSGGARYPLEIYVVNNKISDIQKGIYYYDPLKHRLILLNRNSNHQRKFNRYIRNVQGPIMNRDSDVVFIITAVFARTMWKYGKIALPLIMSDLGTLYQTMYLVATDMQLAACPLGGTNEELVKHWLNLDWFEESHVGTFMLAKP